ncbi:serine-rich adhesin for platelets isoform X1 [Octopus bimaculoides]|uniref:C3H1-type domain-containing protein n=1 Tax=Octopus bimaculoides TaxID=37653 RepID=A0A0L8GS11_OCTBM|nr:serine-rich adhesin for platelets isoform X1 [Octopus bimaculoides]XP_052828709.1 serine-rich adhesin for platelets isoform X1 [Octopus bimaculoides]|eukprot:XP_014778533.1 PREDICTED: serine-rich adhesin for platelets-like [Octopus bimaculoides]
MPILFICLAQTLTLLVPYFLCYLLFLFLQTTLLLCLASTTVNALTHHFFPIFTTKLKWHLKTLTIIFPLFCHQLFLLSLLQLTRHSFILITFSLLFFLVLLLQPHAVFPAPMLHPPFVLWPHNSSNAKGQDCSWLQYQQCCNCQEAADSGAGGVETTAVVAGEAAGVCTILMRDPELRMYAGVAEVELKSSAVEPPTTTTEALVAGADSLMLNTITTSTSSTMITVRIPQSSPLSRTSPPPLLSPPFSVSSSTMSLSSSLVSSSETTKDLPAPTAVTMTITSAAATNASTVAVSNLHHSSSKSVSTQNPVSSSSVAPLLTTTMMMMMSSPLSSTSSLRRSTSSVHNWFQSELDMRGIESVYSRYIISLLLQRDKDSHEDSGSCGPIEGITTGLSHLRREPMVTTSNQSTTKVMPDESKGVSCVSNTKASLSTSAGLSVAGTTTQGRRQKGVNKREKLPLSEEESKKREAVQCLLEVCDEVQAGGIEKLIEELMLKLKELEKKESTQREAVPVSVATTDSSKYVKQDPAERYYAAFPALSTDSSQTTPTIGSPSTVIPGSDNSNVWKKKLQQQQEQQQQEQQQQQLQQQKQQQLMQRKRQFHQVKADKKSHYQSVSGNNCSGTSTSVNSCTKENKCQTKSRRNGNIRRRNDSTIRLGTRSSHTHHGNKENVHKKTESSSLTTHYSSARNRHHNSGFYPLHMVSMKQPQQRTGSGKSKLCRALTCDMSAEIQPLTSHTVTQQQQQLIGGCENLKQGQYYHRKMDNYNNSDYKSSICSDREGQKYCIIVENILKDILLSSNEKRPALAADRDPYSTSHTSHWRMQDQQFQYASDILNQQDILRNQLAVRSVALNQTAPQSISILDPPSPTGSSPLFLLDEINYSYYDQSFRDMKWSNEEINPVPNMVCEAFREDASWYESNFEDPFDTVRCSPVACTTVAEVPSISSVDSSSKLRARLYKRHSYPLPSPSSLDDIQSFTENKIDNFSMLLGPFVETQPPIYPSEKVDSCMLSTSSMSNEPVGSFCQSKQVDSPVAESNHCDKNLTAVTNEKSGNSPISNMVTSGLNCTNDALLTTMTDTNLWSAVTTTTSSSSQTVSYTSHIGENLPKSHHSASCLTTEPNIESVWSFPGHLLVDIQPPQPATAVTSIVLTPQLLLTDSEQSSVPKSSTADATFTTTSATPSLLSTFTCATSHSYLSPRHPSINTESGKVNTSSVCSSTVNTPSSTSPCSTSSLSLVDLSYLTHIAECDSKDPSSLSENISVSNDQKPLNINSENTEDSEILDTLSTCAESLPGNTWKDTDMPALIRSPVLTPGHYPDFSRDSQTTETPENYMTAIYNKLDSSFSAELFAQGNQKWPEQLVFDMRLLWQDHQLQYKKESFSKPDSMLSTVVDPVDGKSISLPDFSIINQLWCKNCNDNNIEEGLANPDEFFTKGNSFSQLWNINCQKRLTMSSQPIPQHRPYSNICSYSPQQLKHNPFTLFLPTVGSVATTSSLSSNSPPKVASLPPISSFLHDNTSLFSPVSIFPSAAVITNNSSNNNNNSSSKQFGNWDYFCCNYYSFYSSSPTGPFYHQQSWPASSSSFFSSPLLSPPLSNSSFMFPLARDFYPEKPVISLPIKVLPTTFVPHAIESAKHECSALVDVKDDNLPPLPGCDKMQDTSELPESDATTNLENRKKFSEVQTSTLPSPPSSVVSIVTSPVSSSTVSSTSPCLLSSSPSSLLQTSVMGPFQASELIPSKCSAFKDVIPRKHTVMAELSETLEDNKSKSLEEEEELAQQSSPVISPHEMLYFSPRTHFRPIKTPPGVGIGHKISLDTLNAVAAADLLVTVGSNHAKSQRFIPENISAMAPILYQPPDLFGGHPECRSPYQDFHQAETIENKTESVHPKIGFVPKFRLHRNTDKYIQTGMSHSSPQEESRSTQFHLTCQQPNESFVDYDLEKLAEEVCSEDNIRDCATASDVRPLPSGFESDCYMSLCTPQYGVSDVGGAFSRCERNKINNAASIWSYDNQSESAGTSSTPSPWGRDNIDSSTTSILGLMASDAKNHYPKTWSRGSDEILNWTPVAVTEAINWTPIAPHDSWPVAVSSSTSSCSSAALDPGNCIHVFSQPSSIADDTHRNPALNISGHVIKEEQWPNNQGSSKSVSMMSSHSSPLSGIVPPFSTISSTNHLSKIPISDVVCAKSDLWQQQQQNTWINSQKTHTWQPALPLSSEAVNPTMWDSNDGCGDTGADHWMLESPGTEDSDWTSETPVHKTSGKQMWPKPEVVIKSQSRVNKDSSSTSLLGKSWSVDDTQTDELDWYFSATSAMKIKETKKALMEATNSQQVWEGNLLQCPVSCEDNINSDVWFNKPLICTPKLSTEQNDWPRSKDCTPETSLSASSYLTTDPLLTPLSLRKSNTWFATSEKPCYWPGKYGNENMNEENTAKKWLSVQPHEMSYDKITNQGYHENTNCKPENIGDVKDIDIYKKNENDINNDNKNKDCCKDVETDNLAEELSALNCERILKKTGTEWLSEKSDHIDWTSVRDMSVALSWPAVPSQASISCSGDHCQEPLLRGWLNNYTLTSNNANFKTTTVVTTGTEKVGPLNWAEPCCMQKSTEKSANSLTLDQTDKTLAVSSKKVMSSNVKKSYENLETLVPLPWEAVYSSELEKEWLNSETSLNSSSTVQLPEGKELHLKSRSIKKPCSFFLEGNCRRTECKFSHDISTITCRFWEDGECFKGDTCPFLHGYYTTATVTSSATTAADKYESAAVGSSSEIASSSTVKELSFLPQSKVTDNPASSQTCV